MNNSEEWRSTVIPDPSKAPCNCKIFTVTCPHGGEWKAFVKHSEWNAAIEEAAKEAEQWWPMFNFESFDSSDPRRFANPNQIAERIRTLLKRSSLDG